ncbi:MAG: hypothetical protein PF447_14210 [Spirochaetaceae bacterium]|jgi:hypothetical protein|nr:hypothetical protein [Spirochaetaceae bacterium]
MKMKYLLLPLIVMSLFSCVTNIPAVADSSGGLLVIPCYDELNTKTSSPHNVELFFRIFIAGIDDPIIMNSRGDFEVISDLEPGTYATTGVQPFTGYSGGSSGDDNIPVRPLYINFEIKEGYLNVFPLSITFVAEDNGGTSFTYWWRYEDITSQDISNIKELFGDDPDFPQWKMES